MFDLATVKLDTEKLDTGVWWKIKRESNGEISGDWRVPPGPDDPAVLVVPWSTSFQRIYEDCQEPHLPALRSMASDSHERAKIVYAINGKAMARGILRGWRNLTIRGEVVEWSEARAEELLTSREWLALHEFVDLAMRIRSAAAAQEEEQAAGN